MRLIWATGCAAGRAVVVPGGGRRGGRRRGRRGARSGLRRPPPEMTITITTTMTAINAPMPSSIAPPRRELGCRRHPARLDGRSAPAGRGPGGRARSGSACAGRASPRPRPGRRSRPDPWPGDSEASTAATAAAAGVAGAAAVAPASSAGISGSSSRGQRRELRGDDARPGPLAGRVGQAAARVVADWAGQLAEQVVGDQRAALGGARRVRGPERVERGQRPLAHRRAVDRQQLRRSRRSCAPAEAPVAGPRAGRAAVLSREAMRRGSVEKRSAAGAAQAKPVRCAPMDLRASRLHPMTASTACIGLRDPEMPETAASVAGSPVRDELKQPARPRARRRVRLDRREPRLARDGRRGHAATGTRRDGPVQPDELPAPDHRRHDPRARPCGCHRGRTTWVWEVEIRDDDGRLCVADADDRRRARPRRSRAGRPSAGAQADPAQPP